jgi:hypothetical protein
MRNVTAILVALLFAASCSSAPSAGSAISGQLTTPTTTTTVPATAETAGVLNSTFATCGMFLTPNDAQTWFNANPDFGQSVDGNGDGTACGDGDFGGATDCEGRAPELVLPQFCDQYQT